MVSVVYSKTEKTSKDLLDYSDWLNSVKEGRSDSELEVLRRAYITASQAHSGQQRASGEPYFQHALAVANILANLKMDYETLVAALLHDVVEDTEKTLHDIESEFGHDVAKLVDGVTKMEAIKFAQGESRQWTRDVAKAETLRKMLLAMVDDVRVVLIKLADRLHNMRTLSALPEDRRRSMARETLDIFAPLANRLGIWQIKWELEDLSFRHLEPELYKKIARLLNERRIDREEYVTSFTRKLDEALGKVGIEATVSGRPKHIYSIYRKMARKELDYSQIYDVRAARVMVPDVRDCYAVLGIVHSLWQYIPGEFDDYVATPKANNYRSLHTAVIGPEGRTVEVQIRTHEMHQHSEFGVAAHWRYKEGAGTDADFEQKIAWLRQVLEWKDEVRDASDFVDKIKTDVFEDRVYVFSPKGDVIDLPKGSTPLDFGYHIHSEVGHRCRGAKVNGRMVPLTYRLKNGEQVEILTVKRGEPSRDWLNPHLAYLKSSKAKAKVQHWFKQQNVEKTISAGRNMLDRELERLGYHDVSHEKLSKALKFRSTDELFSALGRNEVRIGQIVAGAEKISEQRPKEADLPVITRKRPPRPEQKDDVHVLGVGNLLTHLAQCCKPLRGDDIKGYITRGRGVTIHRADCANILRYNNDSPERLIEVHWGNETENTYPVGIQIVAYDRHGLLRDISAVLANDRVNVIAATTLSYTKSNLARMSLTLEIGDIEKLSRVLAKINQLPNIVDARRETY